MKKLRQLLNAGLAQLSKLTIKSNVWVTLVALFLLFGMIILYVATWVFLMFWKAAATLAELKDIIVIMCGAPLIAAISTLRMGLVDKDGDGIADMDEKESENNG